MNATRQLKAWCRRLAALVARHYARKARSERRGALKGGHVGECAACGHWGVLRGRFCAPWVRTGCRERFRRWLTAKNEAVSITDTDMRPLRGPGRDGWAYNYGAMRKRHMPKF